MSASPVNRPIAWIATQRGYVMYVSELHAKIAPIAMFVIFAIGVFVMSAAILFIVKPAIKYVVWSALLPAFVNKRAVMNTTAENARPEIQETAILANTLWNTVLHAMPRFVGNT